MHARTNTGHDARKEPSGSFILSNPQKAIDYAYRAVHVTAETAKKIATDYYAQPIPFSYWNSCSNGGRQGLLEAQRYPDDFDGIVANAPWVDQTGFTIGAMWNQKALTEAPVSPAKMVLVAQKVMDKCDAVDGLKDGLIDDPRACRFDAVARRAGLQRRRRRARTASRPAQAAAINKIYSGPSSKGKPFIAGFMPGSEAVTTGAERRHEQRMGGRDRAGAARRQAGGLQSGRRRDALPDPRPAAAGVRLHEVRLRPRHARSSNAGASWPTRRTPTCRSSARAAAS